VKVEIRAVLGGLKIAKGAKVRRVWVQTDSTVVVGMITNQMQWHPEHSFLLQQCKDMIQKEE